MNARMYKQINTLYLNKMTAVTTIWKVKTIHLLTKEPCTSRKVHLQRYVVALVYNEFFKYTLETLSNSIKRAFVP